MNSILQLTLGIVTAIGGFVDIGELVFSVQAGVEYGFSLLWAVIVGTVGIIIFSEQAGRIAAVNHKTVFQLMKERLPKPLPVFVLIASSVLNIITCAAEVGGVTIAVQLLTGLSHLPALILTVGLFITIIWVFPFKILEKIFGILGICMVIFIAGIFAIHIPMSQIASGLIPTFPKFNTQSILIYLYFAVGIMSSAMMPYEVYFYSSGGVEEGWKPKDLFNNKFTSGVGMSLGGLVGAALLILGAGILKPLNITPQLHGTSVLLASIPFGKTGMIIALLGIMFAVSGAAVETGLAGAYNISQYFGWKWGRHNKPTETPEFSLSWILIFVFAFFVLLFNIEPVRLVEYAVIFSVLVLPFTYFIILRVSSDKKTMKEYASGPVGKTLGWIFFILSCILAVSAIPLMIVTNMGKG